MPKIFEGTTGKVARQIAIVISRYNDNITERLLQGALDTLTGVGVPDDHIWVAWVPGAWEIPLVTKHFLEHPACSAVITLGAVIRGETTHDQYINRSISQELMRLSLVTNKPVAFGVLTVNNLEQAIHRSGGNVGNKGIEAAEAVLRMLRLGDELKLAHA